MRGSPLPIPQMVVAGALTVPCFVCRDGGLLKMGKCNAPPERGLCSRSGQNGIVSAGNLGKPVTGSKSLAPFERERPNFDFSAVRR